VKPALLVYGNCQGSWLAYTLKTILQIETQFEIDYFPNFGTPDPAHPALTADYWKRDPLFIRQTAPDSPPLPFENLLSPKCRQLRFPTLWGKFLWPFNVPDPRNQPEAGLPFGRFFYGDRLVVQWMREGLTPSEILERYLNEDLSKHINLNRYLEICFAELTHIDKQSDITLAPFIEKEFRGRKLFTTINHPSPLLLDYLLNHVKAWIFDTPAPETPGFSSGSAELGEEETPIHPQIISALKLEWAHPGMKYRYRSRMLTFQEYIEAYIRFDLIPAGSSAQLWIERAEQAYQMNQADEAQKLLFSGLNQFPGEPTLYQPLAVLLTAAGDYARANNLLTRALALPGLNAQLQAQLLNNLGITQFYQGDLSRAENSFQQALQLQPGWDEAADNLQEVKKLLIPLI
jgi:hypothetical protein